MYMKKSYLDKKGQLNPAIFGVASAAIGLVVVFIVMGIGADVQSDLYAQYLSNSTDNTQPNTTLIFDNSTAFDTFGPGYTYLDFSSVIVYNTTSLVVVEAANYSLQRNPPGITWTNASTICAGGCYNGTNVTISYQVDNTTVPASAAALNNGTVGIANMSQYGGVLGSVLAATAVIALLLFAFAFGRRE